MWRSKLTEIYYALKILLNRKKVVLLHGFQSTTKIEDTDLDRLKKLKSEFGDKVSMVFKIIYQERTTQFICLSIALGFGVNYVEKHITFNRKKRGVDYYSLEPKELKKFIKILKNSQKSISNSKNDFSTEEYNYRKTTKNVNFKKHKKGEYLKRKM